ncbi:MAG TPA: fibro-slime domain-containing protein [Fibrobacteraceae bacterium]|nr:fibro-slime domain-containing protein [Fibrobacteraceae bacterium]
MDSFHRRLVVLASLCLVALSCSDHSVTSPDERWGAVSQIPTNLQAWISNLGFVGASDDDSLRFDVVIHDFQPDFSDMENFDCRTDSIALHPLASTGYTASQGAYQCYGESYPTDDSYYWACEGGYPCTEKSQSYYGQYTFYTVDASVDTVDGTSDNIAYSYHCHRNEALAYAVAAAAAGYGNGSILGTLWEERVFVTRGMVDSVLDKVDVDDPYTWIPKPLYPTMSCHSDNFDQWFQTVDGVNLSVTNTLALASSDGTYDIDSKKMPGQSFFPLDTVTSASTWGKQGLKLWCPPYDGGWIEAGGTLQALCMDLLENYGGPRSLTGSQSAASVYGADSLLHNYFFTVAGYTTFRYHSGDTLYFSGNDDLWFFVDGYLVADLGGAHNPAEARLVLDDIAPDLISRGDTLGVDGSDASTWADGSKHHLHFFYAERQTDGANFQIRTNIADVRRPKYAAPVIQGGFLSGDSLYLALNTSLSDTSLETINSADPVSGSTSNTFPILGLRDGDTLELAVNSIASMGAGNGYFLYALTASYCTTSTCEATQTLEEGDSLGFNPSVSISNIYGQNVSGQFWGVVQ